MIAKRLRFFQGVPLVLRSFLKSPVNTVSTAWMYMGRRRAVMPLPVFVQIEVTTLCNFRCITCSRESLPETRLNKSTSKETVIRLLEELPSLREIKLQGLGEPLMTPGIEDLISEIRSRNSKIKIYSVTNGSLFLSKKYRDIALMVDDLRISFDSSNAENFEKIRINSNFKRIVDGIKLLMKERNANGSKTNVAIDFVASHLNYGEIPDLENIAVSLGVDEVGVNEVQNWYIPTQKEYKGESDFIAESRKVSRAIQRNVSTLKKRLRPHGINVFSLDSSPAKDVCNWPFNGSFITGDGYVTSCSIRMDPGANNFGNIFEKPFVEIWNNEKYRAFREALITGGSNGICDHCPD